MPLITRRRAKRREADSPRAPINRFPSGQALFERLLGTGALARPACFTEYLWEYADATLRCRACGDSFEWNAEDQRRRYEVYHRSPYSFPPYCPDCSRDWHRKKNLLASYDAKVGLARDGHDLDAKRRVLALLGELDAVGYELTGRMIYTQSVLTLQLAAAARRAEDSAAPHFPTRNHRPLGR